jgi:glycosyltransferase involved in cell wall biosynthesis
LKILLLHNRYRYAGGEDRVVQAEQALLASKGHRIELWEENNDAIAGFLAPCRTAIASVYSFKHARRMRRLIEGFDPDLVHIHNFFPRFSPSVHVAARRAGVAVVQTLHNFRLLCPAATLHTEAGACETCLRRAIAWPALARGCYRQSRFATLAVANMLAIHRMYGTWNDYVSQFIALSEFARNKFIAGGIAVEKITVKPNFVDPDPGMGTGSGGFALFVGRLVEEKGVNTLLAAWNQRRLPQKLRIIGDGPLAAQVAQAAATNRQIEWLGRCDQKQVQRAMADAAVLILPSTWYEGFPLVIAEAFAAGLPVLASRLGAMAEFIADGKTGRLFAPGNPAELGRLVEWAFAHPDEIEGMRRHARAEYEREYTAEANYLRLMAIYRRALENSPATARGKSQLEAIG